MQQDPPQRVGDHGTLHVRVLDGDELAVQAMASELLPFLERTLRRSFAAAPRDAVVDAVVDALIDYIRRPDRFDPSRGVPLRAWLCLAARRNLQNILRREARRLAGERHYAEERARQLSELPLIAPPSNVSAIVRSVCAPSELPAALARLSGERRTSVLARLLGAADLVEAEQRRTVNDRLRIRLATWHKKRLRKRFD